MNKFFRIYLSFLVLFLSVGIKSNAQVYTDAEVKAGFIYQFGLNIEWKNEDKLKKFKIAVYGNDRIILPYLENLAKNQTLKAKPIEILQINSVRELLKLKPQIVYVSESRNYELISIINRIKGKNILSVTDNSLQQKLIMINFIHNKDKTIGFEINKEAIYNQNLKILPELLLLGGSEIDVKELYKEQEIKLKEEREKVENLKKELDRQKKLINELNIEIQQKLTELEKQKKEILIQYEKINKQKEELSKVEEDINKQKILLLNKTKELLQKQTKIHEKEEIIKSQNSKVEKSKKILENLTKEIITKQKNIDNQEKELNTQASKIDKQQNLLIVAGIILFIILLLSILLFKNIKIKQKINKQLIYKNIEVVNKNKQIQKQADELEKHRNKLELLVKERTADLLKAKEKAEESDRLKSAFLANMSHEIRTPMNAIVGFSNLLNKNDFNKEKRRELLSYIIKSSNTLLQLINDIIDISKIEAGQLKISKTRFSVNEIFEDLTILYNEKIKSNNKVKLNIHKNSENLILHTDKLRLKQVLINLTDNAFKFTEKGKIEIKVNQTENEAVFSVADTGKGITKEQQENIFSRFIKLEEDNEKLYRGAGLGLSISKNIVELLGGKIWIESEINKGATFYFTIPLSDNNDKT